MNSRGSAILETLSAGALLLTLLMMTFHLAHAIWTSIWMEHILYQSLICVVEGKSTQICRQKALQQISLMPLAPRAQVLIHPLAQQVRGEIRWQGPFGLKGHTQSATQLHLHERAVQRERVLY